MQFISNDKTVRKDTVQDLQDFNAQSLTTQAKKREQLVSTRQANELLIKKAFNLLGEDLVEIHTQETKL